MGSALDESDYSGRRLPRTIPLLGGPLARDRDPTHPRGRRSSALKATLVLSSRPTRKLLLTTRCGRCPSAPGSAALPPKCARLAARARWHMRCTTRRWCGLANLLVGRTLMLFVYVLVAILGVGAALFALQ